RLDACLAIGRALDFPLFVRVPSADPAAMLQALDSGADGLIVPHVDSPEKAEAVVKAARFGRGGRGFAGTSRWAGMGTRPMGEVLAETADTLVIAQIEDVEGVETCEAICATPGLDGIFLGPADLSVAYGHANQTSDDLIAAIKRVGAAVKANGLAYFTFVPDAEKAKAWSQYGFTGYFIASEHAWMRQMANAQAQAIRGL
ncbi:MAG: aldolase/citrate lyase family protein, partial [Pseudomonadota bacterium]